MTKTLTEQLKKGTLKDGLYYIKDNDDILIGIRYCLTMTRLIDDGCPSFEVLAPLPSYDKWKQAKENLDKNGTWYTEMSYKLLEKKLEIATKALNDIRDVWANNPNEFSFIARIANRKAKTALEEMEGVSVNEND